MACAWYKYYIRIVCVAYCYDMLTNFRETERNWSLDGHVSPEKRIVCQKTMYDQYSKMFGERSRIGG
jgi:hypothetical protein